MAANQIHLQLGELLERDRDFGKLAEPGGYAVDNLVPADDVLDDFPGTQHSCPGFGRELDPQTIDGDGVGFIDGERVAVDKQLLHHFRFFRADFRFAVDFGFRADFDFGIGFGFRADFAVGADFTFLAGLGFADLGFADLGFAVSVALGLGA